MPAIVRGILDRLDEVAPNPDAPPPPAVTLAHPIKTGFLLGIGLGLSMLVSMLISILLAALLLGAVTLSSPKPDKIDSTRTR